MERRFPGFGSDAPAIPAQPPDATAALPPSGVEHRHALLIGNGAYREAPLRNPRRDIRLVGSALAQLGFRVTKLENGDLATLRSSLAEFDRKLRGSDPDTVAILYFAGHGVQVGGLNYLIPVQSDIETQGDLETRALALDDVVAMMAASPRRANILVLDACRDGAFRAGGAGQSAFSGGLASLSLPPAGMLVAFSTAAGRSANDGAGANSPYATALVDSLPRLLEPGLRMHEIFVETAEQVHAATEGRQTPALFLQGGLPALTLAPEDDLRRKRYNPRGLARAQALRTALATSGVLVAVLVATFALLVWVAMAPIDKRAWLATVGLAEPPGAGLSCAAPQAASGLDAYGLAPTDWCQLMPFDLYQLSLAAGPLKEAIAAGLAAGDPKAHFLRAIDAASSFPEAMTTLDGPLEVDIVFDLDRAARSGLAIAAAYWEQLSRQNLLSPRPDLLQRAAADGHAIAKAMLAIIAVEDGDAKGGMARLAALRPGDPTGLAAYLMSLVLAGQVSPDAEVDRRLSADLAREAAQKGYLPAIDWLLDLQDDGQIFLDESETKAMMERLYQAGRERGYWWKFDRLTDSADPKDAVLAMDLLRKMMQLFPGGDAAYQFADRATRGIGGPVTAEELSQALDQAVRYQRWSALTLRGKVRMGLPKGADHQPLLPIDPEGALADLKAAWEVKHDFSALVLMARYHLLAVGGVQDLAAAKAALEIAAKDPAGVSAELESLLASVELTRRMAADHSAADVRLGPAQAPATVTIYSDADCRGCTGVGDEDLRKVVDWLQETYLRHGFARLEFRPLVDDDRQIVALQRFACLGSTPGTTVEQFLASAPTPLDDQQDCAEPARLAAANTARLALLKSAAFADTAAVAPEMLPDIEPVPPLVALRKALPVIVVNGWVVSSLAPEDLEATIYQLLAPAVQIRVRDLGARTCHAAAQAKLVADLLEGPVGKDQPPRRIPLPQPEPPLSGLAADQGVLCAEP